jgi:hypothetical protein
MNKLVSRLTALAALALGCSAPLSAATFDFTYVFGTGETATGSFDGTQNGNIVEDISNISLVLNGVAIAGPLQATAFQPGWAGNAVVGFSVNDSNFIFTDRDPPPFDGNYQPGDHFFFLVAPYLQSASSYIDAVQVSEFAVNANGGPTGWTLTERTAQAPGVSDTASTATLLGLALAGAIAARRRFTAARAS